VINYSLGAKGAIGSGSTQPPSGLYLSYNRVNINSVWFNAFFWKNELGEVSGIAIPLLDATASIYVRINGAWVPIQ